jgi:putative membrane protein
MYIDFLTIMLINLTAGFVMLAHFGLFGLRRADPQASGFMESQSTQADYRDWTPGFALVGFTAVLTGAVMLFTWPLPGSNNIPFGEGSFLFGAVFLATSLAFSRRMGLRSLAAFAFFAGVVAIVLGARILDLGMTKHPGVSSAGFILSGVTAVMASFMAVTFRWRTKLLFRLIFAGVALAAAVIWAINAFDGYWGHLATFSTWKPQ